MNEKLIIIINKITFTDPLSDFVGLKQTVLAFSWRIPSNTLFVSSSRLFTLLSTLFPPSRMSENYKYINKLLQIYVVLLVI